MWMTTQHGFFSIVRKQGDTDLTIRARVPGDLGNLRGFLPELSPTQVGGGTDYPFRATCTPAAFAAAQAKLALDIDYPNFKARVGQVQGYSRASIYGRVWSDLKKLEAEQPAIAPAVADNRVTPGKKASFGGVLLDEQGRVLLRRPTGDFDGARWTFAKGRPGVGEAPEQAAVREVLEETGHQATILAPIPGSFDGTTTTNRYWLMRPGPQVGVPDARETEDLAWCTADEARAHISQSPSRTKRKRDLAVLAAAFEVAASL